MLTKLKTANFLKILVIISIISIASREEKPFKLIFSKEDIKKFIISRDSGNFFSFILKTDHLKQLLKFSRSFNLNLGND